MKLEKVLKKITKGPLIACYGDGICFHEGNRASIVHIADAGTEEPQEVTVAEIWVTDGDQDRYDAAYLAHAANVLPDLVSVLQEAQHTIQNLLNLAVIKTATNVTDEHRKDLTVGCYETLDMAKAVLTRAEEVQIPDTTNYE
jgi:hypothetical protein